MSRYLILWILCNNWHGAMNLFLTMITRDFILFLKACWKAGDFCLKALRLNFFQFRISGNLANCCESGLAWKVSKRKERKWISILNLIVLVVNEATKFISQVSCIVFFPHFKCILNRLYIITILSFFVLCATGGRFQNTVQYHKILIFDLLL